MKNKDYIVLLLLTGFFGLFIIVPEMQSFYKSCNQGHGMMMSFLKFGILATFGEVLGNRIREGKYALQGFGLFPKFLVWGILGMSIKMAFIIFQTGTISFLTYLGFKEISHSFNANLNVIKILIAFCISVSMNLIFAPVMMLTHRIADVHIARHHGSALCLVRPVYIVSILNGLDWERFWNLVILRSIFLFWIPAHTITFLLSEDYQILFAAFLSVVLGIILAMASRKSKA